VQLADVMIGAAIEAANNLAGLRIGGLDPEVLTSLYREDQFIHLLPSIDFDEQRRFRQGDTGRLIDRLPRGQLLWASVGQAWRRRWLTIKEGGQGHR